MTNSQTLFIALILNLVLCQSEDVCRTDNGASSQECNTIKSKTIQLQDLEDSWGDVESKIFFLETSGRPYLKPRQACSVESAARNSGLSAVLVVMTSDHLDLEASNATRQLYENFDGKVHFRRVDKKGILKGTPLEAAVERLDKSPTPIVHYSDAIRLMLVHGMGGWYSDLDMLTIRPLLDLPPNCLASDQCREDDLMVDPDNWGKALSNAIFHFEKRHPVLEEAMTGFSSSFSGRWSSGGPDLLTDIIAKRCGVEQQQRGQVKKITPELFSSEKCKGVNVMPPKTFFPFGWFDSPMMFEKKSDDAWREYFANSHTVHFFSSSHSDGEKILRPRHYGRDRPALLYLALNHCPLSYYSTKIF